MEKKEKNPGDEKWGLWKVMNYQEECLEGGGSGEGNHHDRGDSCEYSGGSSKEGGVCWDGVGRREELEEEKF